MTAIKVPQNKLIYEGGKNARGGVGSVIRRRRENRGIINVKERATKSY